jgi:L-fuconolactonase
LSGVTHHRFPSLDAHELLHAMEGAGVDRAVLVPPAFEGDRNELALAAAQAHPDRFTVMARVPLEDRRGAGLLERWRNVEGLSGVRVSFTREKRDWIRDGTADWFWRAAEEVGIPVMVYAPGAVDDLREIATRHPTLRLAVDHFALEHQMGAAELRRAVDDLARLADLPNVSVKASALPGFVDEPFPFPTLHGVVRTAVRAFGPERVFWGSDMTRLHCSYREALGFVSTIDGLSATELEWVMGRAVALWLDWPELG